MPRQIMMRIYSVRFVKRGLCGVWEGFLGEVIHPGWDKDQAMPIRSMAVDEPIGSNIYTPCITIFHNGCLNRLKAYEGGNTTETAELPISASQWSLINTGFLQRPRWAPNLDLFWISPPCIPILPFYVFRPIFLTLCKRIKPSSANYNGITSHSA